MEPVPTSPQPTEASVAAQIGAAVAAAIANGQLGKSPLAASDKKARVKIPVYVSVRESQALRHVSLELEMRGEPIFDVAGLLTLMARALLNFYANDKSMAHPILRSVKKHSDG